MYAVAYRTRAGFGSVGFLAGIQNGVVEVGDPVLGWARVRDDDCFAVIGTEDGVVLPAVAPALVSGPLTESEPPLDARPASLAANKLRRPEVVGQMVMLTPATHPSRPAFPSGYPLAWERVRRWREDVAVDWRTVALAAMFARTTVRRNISRAESYYRKVGPVLRDAMRIGWRPTESEMRELLGDRSKVASGMDDAGPFLEIMDWAPWVAEAMSGSDDYTRKFRDAVAKTWSPLGLSLAKVSFTLSIAGRDAASIDARILNYYSGYYRAKTPEQAEESQRRAAVTMSAWGTRSEKEGGRGLTEGSIRAYRAFEDKLKRLPVYDPKWPMPLARAQWMFWEQIGSTAGSADHSSLWDVMEPLVNEAGA